VLGFLRVGRALRPLPTGAALDSDTGTFTCTTGAGFVGRYDLVFVRLRGGQPVGRREVRITLAPKGSGRLPFPSPSDTLMRGARPAD
jgi:hypothetical protein